MNLFLDSAFCFTDLFVLILVPHCLDYCSFIIRLRVMQCSSSLFILFESCFGYSGSFVLTHKLLIILVAVTKKVMGF